MARDLPPVAGKVAWVRQLSTRIREPMKYFEEQRNTFKKSSSKQTIKMFHNVSSILLRFEIAYIEAWRKQVESALHGKLFLSYALQYIH